MMCSKKLFLQKITHMKKQLLTFSALAITGLLRAQSIMPEVVSSAGGSGQNSQGSLAWTIGEPVTATVGNGANTLTQGFQQPTLLIATALKNYPELQELLVYPNPTADYVTLKTLGNTNQQFAYSIFDNTGKHIAGGHTNAGNNNISFQGLATGLYTLRLTDSQSKVHQISIIKQN
jgi:hypothetical protein